MHEQSSHVNQRPETWPRRIDAMFACSPEVERTPLVFRAKTYSTSRKYLAILSVHVFPLADADGVNHTLHDSAAYL